MNWHLFNYYYFCVCLLHIVLTLIFVYYNYSPNKNGTIPYLFIFPFIGLNRFRLTTSFIVIRSKFCLIKSNSEVQGLASISFQLVEICIFFHLPSDNYEPIREYKNVFFVCCVLI